MNAFNLRLHFFTMIQTHQSLYQPMQAYIILQSFVNDQPSVKQEFIADLELA